MSEANSTPRESRCQNRLVPSAQPLAARMRPRDLAEFVGQPHLVGEGRVLRNVIDAARKLRQLTGQRTVLFIDEIHRFNKAQQDVVLPYVENGEVILLGATTENPSFEVNSALLSRSRVYTLQPLSEEDVRIIVRRAMADERGLAGGVSLASDAENALVAVSNGDARVALNALELAADATAPARTVCARSASPRSVRRCSGAACCTTGPAISTT